MLLALVIVLLAGGILTLVEEIQTHGVKLGDKRKVTVVVGLALLAVFVVALYFLKPMSTRDTGLSRTKPSLVPQPASELKGIEELKLSPKQLEEYYTIYKDPFVLHIRKALNGYLSGTNEGIGSTKRAVESDRTGDTVSGLDSFSKDYYRSTFIVYAVDGGIGGGKIVNIIFQDNPDAVFTAWVYKLSGVPKTKSPYELRGFWKNRKFNEEDMVQVRRIYRNFIEDRDHSL